MNYIDLRSDTVTMPTEKMRSLMAAAKVGDDVYKDDPTVNELEEVSAKILWKESALFVPSGTQGNVISVMAHTKRGDSIIIGKGAHISAYEGGSYAMLAGVSAVFPDDNMGVLDPKSVLAQISDGSDIHVAPTGLICLENALSNGNVAPKENMEEIYKIAKEHKIPVHVDGARLFNAAVSLGVDVSDLTKNCDSVMCCLSKGLCAPVGSVIAGSKEFIDNARRIRKILGGGMRQAGILAAAGIEAITNMPSRLVCDHENAKFLADELEKIEGILINKELLKINMLFFKVKWETSITDSLPDFLFENGVKILPADKGEFRFVTNNGVSLEDCRKTAKLIEEHVKTNI